MRHTLPGKSKIGHTFAVNPNNVLDKQYFRVGASSANRLLGEDRAIYFAYTIRQRGEKL